ncbi:MAG: hypothetical protein U1C58_06555 [Flavobacteriaceae bacterium]|nr:hypothetical protein [Flavobacteriaceae bacterium]
MRKYISLICLLLISTTSCKSLINKQERNTLKVDNNESEIIVLEVNHLKPKISKLLLKKRIGFNILNKKCNYDTIISDLKKEALNINGNVVVIDKNTPYNTPLPTRVCFKINASIYRVDLKYLDDIKARSNIEINSSDNSTEINIYRFSGSELLKYDLIINDSLIGRIKANYKKSIMISKPGIYEIWLKQSKTEKIKIDIEKGKKYFLRLDFDYNAFNVRPVLKIIDPKQGKKEFEFFNAKK